MRPREKMIVRRRIAYACVFLIVDNMPQSVYRVRETSRARASEHEPRCVSEHCETARMKIDELEHYVAPEPYRWELVRGRLILREPSKSWHGSIAGNLAILITQWMLTDQLESRAPSLRGRLLVADAGFALAKNPDTVRAPDLSWVSAERFARADLDRFDGMIPDFAFEVRSPSNRWRTMMTRVSDFLNAGTPLVWIAERKQQRVHVFRRDGTTQVLTITDVLDGEDVLPNFRAAVARLFDGV
jgi:Uma2 family endonuclease